MDEKEEDEEREDHRENPSRNTYIGCTEYVGICDYFQHCQGMF